MSMNHKLDFEIKTQWDGRPVNHSPVQLSIAKNGDEDGGIIIEVVAPFYDDPPPPVPSGSSQPGLWDYEVVEAFFLGEEDKYLEVEICPHGQYLVLQLDGTRNIIKEGLPLEFVALIQDDRSLWRGSAKLPAAYLPGGLRRFNAYAIHGTGAEREYESLYPAEGGKHDCPDFHRLEYFRDVDWTGVVDVAALPSMSSVWK